MTQRANPSGTDINLNDAVKASQRQSQDFLDLKHNLEKFVVTFSNYEKDQDGKDDEAIKKKKQDIAKVQAEITRYVV